MSDFSTQRYPTIEETLTNNVSVLYRRKKHFLGDLRRLIGTLGFVLISITYLRDLSTLMLFLKMVLHFFLTDPFPSPIPASVFTDDVKNRHARFLLGCVLWFNALSFFFHLRYGPYTSSRAPDNKLHGGFTFQFIGERLPYGVLELLLVDLATFFLQLVFFCLSCGNSDHEILSGTPVDEDVVLTDGTVQLDEISDGYNGNVLLTTVDLFATIQKVMLYRPTETEQPAPLMVSRVADREMRRIFV